MGSIQEFPMTTAERMRRLFGGTLAWLALGLCPRLAAEPSLVTWHTQHARFDVDSRGSLSGVSLRDGSRNFLAPGQPSPLCSVRVGGVFHAPQEATWDPASRQMTLRYEPAGVSVVLAAEPRTTHVRFEVHEVHPAGRVELILWGPYPTTVSGMVGEVVGVVRDADVAVGIQALNAKTLGGFPAQENDVEPDYTADDPAVYPDLPGELGKDQLFRGDTARRTAFGSVLQAYCRDRSRERVIANWGHEKYQAPAFEDGGVVGSKIALFACPAGAALATLGEIELAEGLPHPLLDGVWAKVSSQANGSYLIVDFGEETIDRAVEMTRRAGLRYLYHSSPFETWGHFRLKPDLFPHGWEGLRRCVQRAKEAGVRVGFHTLSNFITPNDPYVTPRPDPRLARIGTSTLVGEVDATRKELTVVAPDFFRKGTAMNTVVIGEELVRYASVSEGPPWRLLECQRGAWGTVASAHRGGEVVAKLMDHGYNVFLTDPDLTQEVARNLARLCNEAGTLQISLDGLEGAWSTGLGQYGRALFTTTWYGQLLPELRGTINDASNPGHFNWHVYTRMNWGEPWYAGFRESQTLYRFKNQLHFERNLMPHMLGWFALRADTSFEDAEWLLARAAGFDAGFTLATSLASTAQLAADPLSAEAARQFGAAPAILEAVKQWETARMSAAFPASTKALLRDNSREFHLEPAGAGRWTLWEIYVNHLALDLAKGETIEAVIENRSETSEVEWILRSAGKQPVRGVALDFDGRSVLKMDGNTLASGASLRYGGGGQATLCDASWRRQGEVGVDADAARLAPGSRRITLRAARQEGAMLKLELRARGPAAHLGVVDSRN